MAYQPFFLKVFYKSIVFSFSLSQVFFLVIEKSIYFPGVHFHSFLKEAYGPLYFALDQYSFSFSELDHAY